jgi:hypothetical protein
MRSKVRITLRSRRHDERGAVVVVVAVLSVVLLGFAALGVDIAQQVNRKHELINQLDAAAVAAAAELDAEGGTMSAAVAAAQRFYAANGEGELDTSRIDFWCVAARELSDGSTPLEPAQVAPLQIPTAAQSGGVCTPDGKIGEVQWRQADYQNRTRAAGGTRSMTCSGSLCAVPCGLQATPGNGWDPGTSLANDQRIRCNTVSISAEDDVPFSFAPVIDIDEGSTGSQISVACAGSCGSVAPNPMDVVVVADRTLSMTDPELCSYYGSTPCRDYRADLVNGIKSMLEVMTPELQYVALGALGPSERTRSAAESYACNASGKGLVYPSDQVSTSSSGAWVPVAFKKDYLGSPDATGHRSVNANSRLIQAINCLDDVSSGRDSEIQLGKTGTALAAPLKAAARYLLSKTGDTNNIAALGGANRPGTVRKVIIFETDGEPHEAASTTSGGITLDSNADIFSKYTDYTTTTSTSGPVLGAIEQGRPSYIARPSQCPLFGSTCSYQYRTETTTQTNTRVAVGGQRACQNFKQVAELAKQAGILVITIGYNLDSSSMCSGNNTVGSLPDPDTERGTHYISNITPSSCRQSGAGTPANPYVPKSNCTQTITWTVPQTTTLTTWVNGAGDASVTSVLAEASGGPDVPFAESTGCTGTEQIAAENSDDDLFFCAAQGQDLAPLFVTALSKVSSGVKLMRMPQ